MKYYLIDASAFVYSIENLGKLKVDYFKEKALGEAFLYIPQFCVTEVLNTFARCFFSEKKISPNVYNKWRGEFIKAIHNRNLLYVYDLHRYHNINTDKIYKIEHQTPLRGKEKYLSSFDILIIGMAIEMKKIHIGNNEVILLTRDGRLNRIAKKYVNTLWFE